MFACSVVHCCTCDQTLYYNSTRLYVTIKGSFRHVLLTRIVSTLVYINLPFVVWYMDNACMLSAVSAVDIFLVSGELPHTRVQ
jgi:hypothetical protein